MQLEGTTERVTSEAFPLLKRLALSDKEFGALTRQGSVVGESKGGKAIFRLRFRVDGQQRVRYVSPLVAADLKVELACLQRRLRAHRRVTALATLAKQLLRQRKVTLAPLLEAQGYYFHGQRIRRLRSAK